MKERKHPIVDGKKECSMCGTVKPFDAEHFAKKREKLAAHCKECSAKLSKQFYEKNKERVLAEYREKYANDPEKVKERVNRYRAANPEKVKEADRQKHRRNQELIAAGLKPKRVRDFATEERRQKRREQYAADPSQRKAERQRRRALQRNAEGFFTAQDVRDLFEKQARKCAYCFCDISNGYHIDHRTPLSRGGSNGPENLALTCGPCNLKKNDKTVEEFLASRKN